MTLPIQTLDDVGALLDGVPAPGLSLAYLDGGEIVARTWGVASRETGAPVTPGTRFQAASISKAVTAFAALQLAAAGRLDIDEDVNALLQRWRVPAIDGRQLSITVRMLLSHMSGAGEWTDGPSHEQVPDVIDVLSSSEVQFWLPPNLLWSYSSDGYLIVGQLLCEATGLPFTETMRELVLEPLRMTSSTFEQPPPAGELAHGHVRGAEMPGGWLNHPSAPAGGMWTTPSDLVRFGNAVNAGQAPGMLEGHASEPRAGLGVFLTSDAGIDWWSHGGSSTGFESMLVGSGRFAAAAMANDNDDGLAILETLRVVSTARGPGPIVLRHLAWDTRGAWARMTAHNSKAVGTYALPGGGPVTLGLTAPDRHLQTEIELTLPGQPPIQLARITDGRWRIPGFETNVVFDPPDTIVFVQAGRELRATRAP